MNERLMRPQPFANHMRLPEAAKLRAGTLPTSTARFMPGSELRCRIQAV